MADTNWTKFWKDIVAPPQRAHPRKDEKGNVVTDSLDKWGHIGDFIRWANQPIAPQPNAKPGSAAAPDPGLDFGTGSNALPSPAQTAASFSGSPAFQDFAKAIIGQESGGRYGLTSSAGAQGLGQVMPATAQALAKRAGIPWKPNLMTDNSPAGQDYQRQIAQLALEDAWTQGQGDPAKAAQYYHAGPNPAQAGPKTAAYVGDILGRLGLAQASPGNPFVSRGVPFVDPQAAMSMIPNPARVGHVDLPDAPVLAADPARPQYAPLDVAALLAPLQAASAPVQPDEAARQKDLRFGDIQGAIQGGLIGLAGGPLGVLIGAALGGLNSHSSGRRGQLAEDKALKEQQRKVAMTLAAQGLDLNLQNQGREDRNLDQAFLTEKNQVDTGNTNAINANQRMVEEILKNAGIDQFNVAAQNDTNRTRASVGISALEGAAAAAGQANREQSALDAAALNYNQGTKGLQTRANQILAGVGIPAERLDGAKPDASLDNVRNTAYAVAANNVEGALSGMASEIVTNGLAKDILGENDAKAVEKALREKNTAAAVQIVANALNADRVSAAKLADELASRGLTTAKIISGNRKRADQAGGQQQPAQAARQQ